MNRFIIVLAVAGFLFGCGNPMEAQNRGAAPGREPVVGPCDGCEIVFQGLPATIPSVARIAPSDEPGDPMRIEGTVRDRQGRPVAGVIVYAYHTNAKGIYPMDETLRQAGVRHGRLRGWAKTDQAGTYRFDTIRPASYPNTDNPAHVHMHVIEVGRGTYYIDDILFDDDPLLTSEKRRRLTNRGGNGIMKPRRDETGRWLVSRDIVLGENIPGYPAR